MQSTGKHKTHKFKDQNLPCEIEGCGRHFVSPQGLIAHRRMSHGIVNRSIPDPEVRVEQVSAKELESEVKILKLQQEKRELEARLPSTTVKPLDIMQQVGLGEISGEAQNIAQKRVLGLRDQGQAESWLGKLLSSPEGIKTAVEALRGILGSNNNNQGDNTATLLQSMGFNLKDLLQNSLAPKGGASLEIAGMNLGGASLTPQLLGSLLDYKAKVESAEKVYLGQKEMADGLKNLLHLIGEGIGSGAISLGKRGAGRDISRRIPEVAENVFTCPVCNTENPIPAEAQPGMKIQCLGEGCEQSWVIEDRQAQKPKPARAKKQVKVEEAEPPTINCPSCGQLLDVANKGLTEIIVCPACREEYTITSDNIAIKADKPLPELEKQSQAFLRG